MSVIAPDDQLNHTVHPQPSNFTFKDLRQLNDKASSYKLALSVIAHIDLNAFFAQVEQLRLNLTIDDPVVFVQWQSVIAVSYAARKYGISRMDTVKTCREKCPQVILAHGAVYEKGCSNWKYLDKLPSQSNCKISLDPCRRESRKIFRLLRSKCDVIQKASVDEGYLDFGRLVYDNLLRVFPVLNDIKSSDKLPQIPLDVSGSFKGMVFGYDSDIIIRDWDDIVSLIASNILYDIRTDVYEKLGYTTSGGIGRNKKLAKLAGGFLKPDNQTIIVNSKIPDFLKKFELIEINGLGGKLGDSLMQYYNVPGDVNSMEYLMSLDPEKLTSCTLVNNFYDIVWGDDRQELKDRTDIKSMMSRKQMTAQNPISTLYDCMEWIKTFSGDLRNRLEDLDEESGYLTRPKTILINVHVKKNNNSKQCPIAITKDLDKLRSSMESISLKLTIEVLESFYDLNKLNQDQVNFNVNPFNKVTIPPIHNFAIIISTLTRIDNAIDKFSRKDTPELQFAMYEAEQLQLSQQRQQSPPPKKQKLDKQFISTLFANYEKNKDNDINSTKKPKLQKYDIMTSLKTHNKCKICDESFQTQQEHDEYHRVLELSRIEK